MLNFKELEIVTNTRYSFVGIKREDGKSKFYLPHGFDHFDGRDFNKVKSLFFSLYKTFRKFEIQIRNRRSDRDGTEYEERGVKFQNKDGTTIILYSKLTMLDRILQGYDDLTIFSLANKLARTERIDYSKIDKYLDKAVYLPNHTIYIDEMILPKQFLQYASTDLVGMYCFIYSSIKQELGEVEKIRDEVKALAQAFKEEYLSYEAKLFHEDYALEIADILKGALENIHRNASYKDEDYWHFYEAIETFLYTDSIVDEEGSHWGIDNFYSVWEAMCHAYFFETRKNNILFADTKAYANERLPDGNAVYIANGFQNPFHFQINKTPTRYIRPDLVWQKESFDDLWKNPNPSILDFFNNYELTLEDDGWDDYGHKIAFNLHILDKNTNQQNSLFFRIADSTNEDRDTLVSDIIDNQKGKITRKIDSRYLSSVGIETAIKEFPSINHALTFLYIFNNITALSIFKNQHIKKPFYDSHIYKESLFRGMDAETEEKYLLQILDEISISPDRPHIRIIDYKYHPSSYFLKSNSRGEEKSKLEKDLTKQLVYEYAVQLNLDPARITNQLWIPTYIDNKNREKEKLEFLDEIFLGKGIQVYQVNFAKVQQSYLSSDYEYQTSN